ncbi:MAG: A24 family peptidase [Alphaproteobacteria bacterium]
MESGAEGLPAIFSIISVILLGLCLGSFASAMSWRLPRGISFVTERSQCPSCRATLGVVDLVPVFSWLFLGGKCRRCKAPIGWRYPLIELSTLLLCLLFLWRFHFSPALFPLLLLAPVIVSIIDIDLHHKIIPDGLNASVALFGFMALALAAVDSGNPPAYLSDKGLIALAGALLYGLGSLALRYGMMLALKKDPLGLGDVKFFAAAGFWFGLSPDALAAFMLISGLMAVFLALLWRKVKKELEFPFGPALVLAFLLVLLVHPPEFLTVYF